MGDNVHLATIRATGAALRSEMAQMAHGVDGLALLAVLNRMLEHSRALEQQNAELLATVDQATSERERADVAKQAAESREAACYRLIEDMVKHFHLRDRRISEVMHADTTYTALLSRAMHVEDARRNGVQINAGAPEPPGSSRIDVQ